MKSESEILYRIRHLEKQKERLKMSYEYAIAIGQLKWVLGDSRGNDDNKLQWIN